MGNGKASESVLTSPPRMYINILLDTVLATHVNKYSLASLDADQYGGP